MEPAALPECSISGVMDFMMSGETIPIMKTGGNSMQMEQTMTDGMRLCMPISQSATLDVKGMRMVNAAAKRMTLNRINGFWDLKERMPPTKYPAANPPRVMANTVAQT